MKMILAVAFGIFLFAPAISHAQDNIKTMTVEQINENLYTISDNIIKLRFESRGDIKQLSAELACVNLWDKSEHNIYVEFPVAGIKFFKTVPTESKGISYYVYAQASPELLQNKAGASFEGPKLTANGSRMEMGLGGEEPKYKW